MKISAMNVKIMIFLQCLFFGYGDNLSECVPLSGIPSFHDLEEVEENSVRICLATHPDPRCLASCVFMSLLVASMLQVRSGSLDISFPCFRVYYHCWFCGFVCCCHLSV